MTAKLYSPDLQETYNHTPSDKRIEDGCQRNEDVLDKNELKAQQVE